MHYTEFSSQINKIFRSNEEQTEFFANDIRTCTFLTRDKEGIFTFIHPSFMEFFFALYLFDKIMNDSWRALSNNYIPREVLFFLADLIRRFENELNFIKNRFNLMKNKTLKQRESKFVSNVLNLYSLLNKEISKNIFVNLDSRDVLIDKILLNNLNIALKESKVIKNIVISGQYTSISL